MTTFSPLQTEDGNYSGISSSVSLDKTFVDHPVVQHSPSHIRHLENITRISSRIDTAPLAVAFAIVIVFILSPMILCGNSLILNAVYRYKRLRTPSNYLLASLAASDFGVGLFLPVGLYLELTSAMAAGHERFSASKVNATLCLVPYCVAVSLCSASVLIMAAIAVDRFTSLAQPLRYNNLITHTSVERYIAAFWVYSTLVGFTPLIYSLSFTSAGSECAWSSLVGRPVLLFLFCAVYGPAALVLLACYCYIYIVARYHARAIYSVELSLRQHQQGGQCRYGQTLAITVGLFLTLWLPFQACMLVDVFSGSRLLDGWTTVFLALPIGGSSAINPWVYGYRNSEVRGSVQRAINELLARLGFAPAHLTCPQLFTTNADPAELNSFASNVRLCAVSPNRTTLVLLASGRFETSTVVREANLQAPNVGENAL